MTDIRRERPTGERVQELSAALRSLALPPGGKVSKGGNGDDLPGLNAGQLEHVLARISELDRLIASADRSEWDGMDDAAGQIMLQDIALVTGQFRTSIAQISLLLDDVLGIIASVKSAVPVVESALAALGDVDEQV
ncbi:MAG: hypothetical protein AB7I25_01430 [Vicinamibacterales bacterium]